MKKLLILLAIIIGIGFVLVALSPREELGASALTIEVCGQTKPITLTELTDLKNKLFNAVASGEPIDPCYMEVYFGLLNELNKKVPMANIKSLKDIQAELLK